MVAEYSAEIFAFLYRRELETLPSHNYLLDKTSKYYLRPSMRTILVDWLVEVHEKFQCYPKTLFLSINLMDRFFS
ncbi:ANM_collapsed_G0058540.mRNA.1.CDS.1 [Saccharomyces cerevisiae]|nr:ANM_collapsed_G0058540.mRNA.1.CDS.1 [Saccharomyces cerevisiae]